SLREEDGEPAPPDASRTGDEADLLAIRISERLQAPARGIGARRARIVLRRGRVAERLVRTQLVEVSTPLGEAPVLLCQRSGRRMQSLFLQRAMHALMHPILLRDTGADALGTDAEAQPPYRQWRQSGNRARAAERHAVVAANDLRQPVLAKVLLKQWAHAFGSHAGEPRAAEHRTRVQITHRKRVAVAAIAKAELPLEVRSPDVIRCQG